MFGCLCVPVVIVQNERNGVFFYEGLYVGIGSYAMNDCGEVALLGNVELRIEDFFL